MNGLEFIIKNEYNDWIYQILRNLSFENYIWKIDEDDVYYNNDFLFDKDFYNNDEFFRIIKGKNYYTVFCNIQLYSDIKDCITIDVPTDFINSKCELILLITDNIFVEVYSKNEDNLNMIKDNLKLIGIKNVKKKNIMDRCTMYARGE